MSARPRQALLEELKKVQEQMRALDERLHHLDEQIFGDTAPRRDSMEYGALLREQQTLLGQMDGLLQEQQALLGQYQDMLTQPGMPDTTSHG
jgi:hypothetical protein